MIPRALCVPRSVYCGAIQCSTVLCSRSGAINDSLTMNNRRSLSSRRGRHCALARRPPSHLVPVPHWTLASGAPTALQTCPPDLPADAVAAVSAWRSADVDGIRTWAESQLERYEVPSSVVELATLVAKALVGRCREDNRVMPALVLAYEDVSPASPSSRVTEHCETVPMFAAIAAAVASRIGASITSHPVLVDWGDAPSSVMAHAASGHTVSTPTVIFVHGATQTRSGRQRLRALISQARDRNALVIVAERRSEDADEVDMLPMLPSGIVDAAVQECDSNGSVYCSTLNVPRVVVRPPHGRAAVHRHEEALRCDTGALQAFANASALAGASLASREASLSESVALLVATRRSREIRSGSVADILARAIGDRQTDWEFADAVAAAAKDTALSTRRLRDDEVRMLRLVLDKEGAHGSGHRSDNARPCHIAKAVVAVMGSKRETAGVRADDKYEQRMLSTMVTPDMVRGASMGRVAALTSAKRELERAILLRIQRPELFERGALRETAAGGVLLFGPPGTGKTMLARAVAAEAGASFFAVSAASIFDMYVGESEKNVRALFRLARRAAPAVVFVDEIDAVLEARGSGGPTARPAHREVVAEFLAEWDGLLAGSTAAAPVVVVGATNRPHALDEAVVRRMSRRVLVDLPDRDARHDILALHVAEDSLSSDVDMHKLALFTDGYSGSDLRAVARAAAERALQRVLDGESGALVLSMDDFERAVSSVGRSTSPDMASVAEMRAWNALHGTGAVRQPSVRVGF